MRLFKVSLCIKGVFYCRAQDAECSRDAGRPPTAITITRVENDKFNCSPLFMYMCCRGEGEVGGRGV